MAISTKNVHLFKYCINNLTKKKLFGNYNDKVDYISKEGLNMSKNREKSTFPVY